MLDSMAMSYATCKKHKSEELILFCNNFNCRIALCSSCVHDHCVDHVKQDTQPQLLIFRQVRVDNMNRIKKLKESLNDIRLQMQKNQEEWLRLIKKKPEDYEMIQRSKDQLINMIEQHYDNILHSFRLVSKYDETKINSLLKDLNIFEGQLQAESECENAIVCCQNRDFEQELVEAQGIINEKISQTRENEAKFIQNMKVEINQSILDHLKNGLNQYIHLTEPKNEEIAESIDMNKPVEMINEESNQIEMFIDSVLKPDYTNHIPESPSKANSNSNFSFGAKEELKPFSEENSLNQNSKFFTPTNSKTVRDQVSTDVPYASSQTCSQKRSSSSEDINSSPLDFSQISETKSTQNNIVASLSFLESTSQGTSSAPKINNVAPDVLSEKTMEIEKVPIRKSGSSISEGNSKKDPVSFFREKLDRLKNKNKSPLKNKLTPTRSSESILNKRKPSQEAQKKELSPYKLLKSESQSVKCQNNSTEDLLASSTIQHLRESHINNNLLPTFHNIATIIEPSLENNCNRSGKTSSRGMKNTPKDFSSFEESKLIDHSVVAPSSSNYISHNDMDNDFTSCITDFENLEELRNIQVKNLFFILY